MRGGDRTRDRRVYVAHNDDEIRLLLDQQRIEAANDLRDLPRDAAAADLEIHVTRVDPELVEEYLRHRGIVVLSSVNEDRFQVRVLPQLAHDRSDLHEVRTSACDEEKSGHYCGL